MLQKVLEMDKKMRQLQARLSGSIEDNLEAGGQEVKVTTGTEVPGGPVTLHTSMVRQLLHPLVLSSRGKGGAEGTY